MKSYLFILIVAMSSCNATINREDAESLSAPPPISGLASLTPGCYRMIIGQDSAIMNLSIDADSVRGRLHYNRFEKADNSGEFSGKVDSNKVIGWYKFQSEGVITVRQVIFKITGNKLAEAYGDVNARGDTAYFTYPHTLNYEEAHTFEKIACP